MLRCKNNLILLIIKFYFVLGQRDTEPPMRGPMPPPRREYDPYQSPRGPPMRRRPNYDGKQTIIMCCCCCCCCYCCCCLDELISKTLHVDQKRFYIDLKENGFGKFIKIIEVTTLVLIKSIRRLLITYNTYTEIIGVTIMLLSTLYRWYSYKQRNTICRE